MKETLRTVLTFPNVWVIESAPSKDTHHHWDVTLTIQLHANPTKFERFEEQIRAWNGPISVAVYLTSAQDLEIIQKFVKFNMGNFRHSTRFHLYVENNGLNYPTTFCATWC